MKLKILLVFLSLLVISGSGASVLAESPESTPAGRLSQLRLKVCETRAEVINTRMTGLNSLVVRMEGTFDGIAQRVEDFYTSKVLSKGLTLSNYDALVNDIQAKKNAVTAAINTVQADSTNFNCSSDDPKGVFSQYRADIQKAKSALHDYRTAIKNLIVAIHSLVRPEPTATP